VVQSDGTVAKQRLALINSSLASQAMAAPINDQEMSCSKRSLADIGRKLLYRNALENQTVHPRDSVLGSMAAIGQKGLTVEYITLIKQAFHPRFWSYNKRGPFGAPVAPTTPTMRQAYSQPEANFSLFFGLALQAYQSTLVSDDSPFDRSHTDAQNLPTDLTPAQLRGLQIFRRAHCAMCHTGPNFTASAIDTNAALVSTRPWAFGDSKFRNITSTNVVTRMAGIKGFGLIDTGFAATGVGKDEWDPGLAGKDDLGHDIALASQYLRLLTGQTSAVLDPRVSEVRACDLATPIAYNRSQASPTTFTQREGVMPQTHSTQGCLNLAGAFVPTPSAASAELASANNKRMLLVTDSAFKIPTLRNIDLTGPYMHNGSMATLDHVIEFYARGGNFAGASKQFGTVFGQPELQLDAQARSDLMAFLLSLTDERVRYERAPFDHPELKVPHGQTGDRTRVKSSSTWPGLAADDWLLVPAVGAEGISSPLQPFHAWLDP
jgi:Di-haem cytochrome c peroxidase